MVTLTLMAAGALAACFLPKSVADVSLEKGSCEFVHEPLFPGYFWDPACQVGKEGCLADGKNVECRFCGGGGYDTPCPPSSCHFHGGDPFVPYYWEPLCETGMLGCWADGIHSQCRFCGEFPYTSIPCPEKLAAPPQGAACAFAEEPETPHFWDPACEEGMHGCLADGINKHCRFCGMGIYADITCPASTVCSFADEPTVPYYWDADCSMGKLGCMADGVHLQCRFCAKRPFEDINCPENKVPPKNTCTWPLHGEPLVPYYWEPSCAAGKLGCWADGIHASCRFCGEGVFENISCPEESQTPAASTSLSVGTSSSAAGSEAAAMSVEGAAAATPGASESSSATLTARGGGTASANSGTKQLVDPGLKAGVAKDLHASAEDAAPEIEELSGAGLASSSIARFAKAAMWASGFALAMA